MDVANLVAASIAAIAAIVTVTLLIRDRQAAARDRLVAMADLVEGVRVSIQSGTYGHVVREDTRRRLRNQLRDNDDLPAVRALVAEEILASSDSRSSQLADRAAKELEHELGIDSPGTK